MPSTAQAMAGHLCHPLNVAATGILFRCLSMVATLVFRIPCCIQFGGAAAVMSTGRRQLKASTASQI